MQFAKFDVSWVLNHQYVQLHEVSREKNTGGSPQYEAVVLIGLDAAKNQYLIHVAHGQRAERQTH